MAHIPLLDDLVLIAAVAVIVSLLLHRARLPPVSGLIVAGLLVGPHSLGLIGDHEAIETIAEIGVVLLLFTVGLEFSLSRLRAIWRYVFIGGALQVVGTTVIAVAVASMFGIGVRRGLVFGFVFALSSTAIVLRLLIDRRELDAPHGRVIVGALILQDLCVVPMVLLVPALAGEGSAAELAMEAGTALGKAALVVAFVFLTARYLVPKLLALVDAARSRDLFLLTVIAICIGTAWLTAQVGLSLALGAFLGGIVVADTEFGHRAMGDVLPLRDAFVAVFFVSLGMLLDASLLVTEPLPVFGLFLAFVLGKGAIATFAAMLIRFPPRVAWLAGVGLAQFGEFGFVLLRLAQQGEAVTDREAGLLMTAGVLSMLVTPLLARMAPHVTAGERLLSPLAKLLRLRGLEEADAAGTKLDDHVIVVGYGVCGRLVGDALETSGIPHVVLELNGDTVRSARAAGQHVYYGDATSPEVLAHAHVERARAVVLTFADPGATPRVVAALRAANADLPVLVRARYVEELRLLGALKVASVAVEEVEVGVELVARVLRTVGVPRNRVRARVDEARERTLKSERELLFPTPTLEEADPRRRIRVDALELPEDAPALGHTVIALDLRKETGATAVAVVRDQEVVQDDVANTPLAVGDVLYLAGSEDAIVRASAILLG